MNNITLETNIWPAGNENIRLWRHRDFFNLLAAFQTFDGPTARQHILTSWEMDELCCAGPHFSSVSVERILSSYVVTTSALTQRYSIYVPGILAWGDIDLLAALSQCEVHIHSLVDANGQLQNQINPYPIQKFNFT
jgi:hypothetical protein